MRFDVRGLTSVLGLAVLVGCGEVRETTTVTVTNRVTVTVTVTNTVTERVTVTNAVTVNREPERSLTARRTAPYLVSTRNLDAVRFRKLLSDAGARVLGCESGAVATIEAPDKVVETLAVGGVMDARPMKAADKASAELLSAKGQVPVRIVPLSSIDLTAVAAAVRGLHGELVQVVTSGGPAVRAKLNGVSIRELAGRADVWHIERDGK